MVWLGTVVLSGVIIREVACRSDVAVRRLAAEAEERRNGFVIGNDMKTIAHLEPFTNYPKQFS